MAFQDIFVDKKNGVVYLWDDIDGLAKIPLTKFHYAYRRSSNGPYKSLYGDCLEKITSFDENDPTLFESDILPEMRVLLDVYPNNDEMSKNHRIIVIDIEVSSEEGFPDITKGDKPITAIALYDQAMSKYYSFVLDPESKISGGVTSELETRSYKCEDTLLHEFLTKWEEIRPTIVTGWNTSGGGKLNSGFDMPYIYNRIRAVLGKQASYRLSPIGIAYQNKFNHRMIIAGVSLLDYMELYKKFIGVMKSSWSLGNVAKDEELKQQKLTYRGSLNELYKTDICRYTEYNLADVRIVVELDKKYDFIHLARSICHKGFVKYEWFQMSSRWIDGAILCYLHSKGIIGPNKPPNGREEYEKMEREGEEGFIGAYVKQPIPGLYEWVCSADITSLYPSVIMSLNISPESKIGKIDGWDKLAFDRGEMPLIRVGNQDYSDTDFKKMISNYTLSVGSNGAVYRQDVVGVVPYILDKWFLERVHYRQLASEYSKKGDKEKEAFYDRRQKREKIFLNSCYGVLGLPIFRFYDKDNAESVTLSGQTIIRGTEKIVNDYFNQQLNTPDKDYIIYADTDSNYFSVAELAMAKNILPEKMIQFSIDALSEVCNKINRFYEYMVPKIFNVAPEKNRIKIVPDVIAEKALWVAKKRYAMLKVFDMEKMKPVKDKQGNEGKLEVKGIDVVRSSFPRAFQKFASGMLNSILRNVPQAELDERIMIFEEGIAEKSIYDLCKTSSVRFISKDEKNDYNPPTRKLFQFINKSPAQVRAALAYNDLLKVWKLDRQFEKITHSEKIKWCYLLPNDFYIEALAIKGDDTDPDEILNFITTHIDRNKMYQRELKSKLGDIYEAISWKYPNRGSQLAEQTFDFSEEF